MPMRGLCSRRILRRKEIAMRKVFIAGASSDIGIAVCREYLARGYKVIAHYCQGQQKFFELLKQFPQIETLKIDFTNLENLERALLEKYELFLETDVIVNAQGLMEPVPFSNVTAEVVLRALAVNVVPGILLMRALVPGMIERKWGRIVHLSSISAKYGGGKNSFCYSLSKHAMEFMPSDHKEWAADGVFVNALRIGVTDTRIHRRDVSKNMRDRVALIPAGRMATPEEMAKVVFWYGSEENTFTTGQVITVAGGE